MNLDRRPAAESGAPLSSDEQDFASARQPRKADDQVTTIPRSRFHEAATWCAQRVAVGLHSLSARRLAQGFGILMYHRVADRPAGVETPTVNVTPHRLTEHLEGLLSRGFQAWPLRRVLDAWHESQPIPSNVFVVTFDDGYENNLLDALPILEKLDIPATIFLATSFLDSGRPFPFDNWTCAGSCDVPAPSWRPLSTEQCHKLLAHELIELGAHTHTHGAFAGRLDDFRQDLSTSLDVMRDRFGITHPTFTFPFGLTTPEMITTAEESGVPCALGIRPERIQPDLDPFHWGRFTASDLDTAATLEAKLYGWYTPVADVLRKIKRPMAAIAPKTAGELVDLSEPCFAGDRDR